MIHPFAGRWQMWRNPTVVVALLAMAGLAGCAGILRVPDEVDLTDPTHPLRVHEEMRLRAEEDGARHHQEAVSRALEAIPAPAAPPAHAAPESE
jgi:hypothetical protein